MDKAASAAARINRTIKYFLESLSKLKVVLLLNIIDLAKLPFTVLNPVLYTIASASYLKQFVPAYNIEASLPTTLNGYSFSSNATLLIGIDSPVNIASFTIALPFIRIASQGSLD